MSVSTSEAQVIARVLYDSLITRTLDTLRTAATKLSTANGEGLEQRISAALPADAPRELRQVLLALANEGTLNLLPHVASAFERYAEQTSQERLEGEIISAVELDEAQRAHIAEDLRTRYGSGIELRFQVDPSLIGGLIIRVGDQVLDNSLRARLSAIQRNMLTS